MTNTDFNNADILKELEEALINEESHIQSNESEVLELDTSEFKDMVVNSETIIETEKSIETFDIFDESNEGKIEEDIFETIIETEKVNVIIKKKKNGAVSSIVFLTKYILTSTLIFAVLLISTNYSAYINIAKSYVFAGEMLKTEQRLISSVEASSIKEKYVEVVVEEIKEEKEKTDKLSIKKMKKEQDKENLNLNIEITPYENRVVIPKIGQNIPLIDIKNRNIDGQDELNDIFMKELENGIIRYPGSAKPGENGTSFIFGHSSNFPWIKGEYNDVFSLLDKVVFNDEVIVYYGQEKYVYKIREKQVITPGDVSVLERNKDRSEITLMTCWPIGTTLNRLIVTGELVDIQ